MGRLDCSYNHKFSFEIKEPQLIDSGGTIEQVRVLDERLILVYNLDIIKAPCVCVTVMDTEDHNKFKYIDILK